MDKGIKTCEYCKKKFSKPKKFSFGQFAKRKYCSSKCAGTVSRKLHKISPALGKHWKRSTPVTQEERERKSAAQKGEKGSGWKGGLTTINMTIRKSYKYKQWRDAVYQRDNYTCQVCGERGGKLNADHIKPFSKFPELRFDVSNGRTLCLECHKKTETFGWKVYNSARNKT